MLVETESERYCIGCGYNLRGLSSEKCPECGLRIDTAEGSAIPWEGRKELGSIRAFWRTFVIATIRVKRLALAAARPVNAKSALGFRTVIAVLTALSPSVLLWIAIKVNGGTGFLSALNLDPNIWPAFMGYPLGWEILVLWSAGATLFQVVLPIGLFITVLLGTGVVGYWVRGGDMSAERRKRAASVSAYLFAPMPLIFIPTAAAGVIWASIQNAGARDMWTIEMAAASIGALSLGAIGIVCLVNSLRLISYTAHCGAGRLMLAAIGLPISWALAAIIGLGLFPVLMGLVWLMIDSLRQ